MGFICDNNLSSILQYTIKSEETKSKINFEFEGVYRDCKKTKEANS